MLSCNARLSLNCVRRHRAVRQVVLRVVQVRRRARACERVLALIRHAVADRERIARSGTSSRRSPSAPACSATDRRPGCRSCRRAKRWSETRLHDLAVEIRVVGEDRPLRADRAGRAERDAVDARIAVELLLRESSDRRTARGTGCARCGTPPPSATAASVQVDFAADLDRLRFLGIDVAVRHDVAGAVHRRLRRRLRVAVRDVDARVLARLEDEADAVRAQVVDVLGERGSA